MTNMTPVSRAPSAVQMHAWHSRMMAAERTALQPLTLNTSDRFATEGLSASGLGQHWNKFAAIHMDENLCHPVHTESVALLFMDYLSERNAKYQHLRATNSYPEDIARFVAEKLIHAAFRSGQLLDERVSTAVCREMMFREFRRHSHEAVNRALKKYPDACSDPEQRADLVAELADEFEARVRAMIEQAGVR